jgi:autotransporter translocation and assembly factor TamB
VKHHSSWPSGTIPINLALRGVTGPRIPTNRQIDLAIRADTLPLNMIPQVNQYVTNLKGKVLANFKVGGTLSRPEITGQLTLNNAEARVVPVGDQSHENQRIGHHADVTLSWSIRWLPIAVG